MLFSHSINYNLKYNNLLNLFKNLKGDSCTTYQNQFPVIGEYYCMCKNSCVNPSVPPEENDICVCVSQITSVVSASIGVEDISLKKKKQSVSVMSERSELSGPTVALFSILLEAPGYTGLATSMIHWNLN